MDSNKPIDWEKFERALIKARDRDLARLNRRGDPGAPEPPEEEPLGPPEDYDELFGKDLSGLLQMLHQLAQTQRNPATSQGDRERARVTFEMVRAFFDSRVATDVLDSHKALAAATRSLQEATSDAVKSHGELEEATRGLRETTVDSVKAHEALVSASRALEEATVGAVKSHEALGRETGLLRNATIFLAVVTVLLLVATCCLSWVTGRLAAEHSAATLPAAAIPPPVTRPSATPVLKPETTPTATK